MVNAYEEFIDLSPGRRIIAWIIKDEFDHSLDGTDVIGLNLVIVPSLHYLGIGGGEIDLTELHKQVVIRPQNLHQPSPVIRNRPQQLRSHPVYHLIPLRVSALAD